jgi:hypothetical protein
MHRKRLVATVAAAPLLVFAQGAWAETTVTTAVTTPVQTATTNDDVRVTSSGSIRPTVSGPALLLNSNDDDITNEGSIGTTGVNNSTGMQAQGGFTGSVTNKGSIQMVEDYSPTDTDSDGDIDGAFATGSGRYGIRVVGPGTLNGSVLNDTGASITVEGNDSAGISIETDITGSLTNKGSISVIGGETTAGDGNESYGVHTTGDIGGDVTLNGSIGVVGRGSVGAAIDSDVGGALTIQGAISARGYRSPNRPFSAEDRAKLDADDLAIGGPAVRIGGNVAEGILIDIRPADEDANDTDEDDDGVADNTEGNGVLTSFGTAPALLIGSTTQAVTVGAVGTGDNAFGLISKGTISADGVYDGKAATALQIGAIPTDPDPAQATTITGGIRLDGAVTARAFQANSTGIVLNNLATLGADGVLWNQGQITSQVIVNSAPLPPDLPTPPPVPIGEGSFDAIAIKLAVGSTAPELRNDGVIAAAVAGENSDAIAIQDLGGSLETITNTGRIQAVITPTDDALDTDDADIDPSNETIRGERVAIDVAANTSGVTITQTGVDDGDDDDDDTTTDPDADEDGVDDADEPLIFGNVKLGSGADEINLANGSLQGDVTFGDGADALNISGGAVMVGKIFDSDDQLAIDVADGQLAVSFDTSKEPDDATSGRIIGGTSLDVGADGVLVVAIDGTRNISNVFDVTTASFATGAQVGVRLDGLIEFATPDETKPFLIVDADDLTVGTLDSSLLGISPYLYNVGVVVDAAADNLSVTVSRRTALQAGLNAAQTAAFDAFYLALAEDEAVRDAFLARFTRDQFLALYNQMLPDQGEGLFSALDYANLTIGRAVATRPDPRQRYGPDSFWLHELNVQVKRDGGETLGSEAKGFGFVGGYEAMDDKGGALGLTLAYVNAEENDDAAQVGEQTAVSLFEAGAYWRKAAGSWLFSVRGGAGYAFFDGTRRFVAPAEQTIRTADADWGGFTGSASASVGYEARFGRYYVRPLAGVDYLYLKEGERDEDGGGDTFNLTVDERTSSRLSATAELAVGAEFGRDFWWRPEVKVGYRQVLAGEVGDTVAAFTGGTPFTLVAMDAGDGAAIVGLALRAGTPMSYLAAELEMERVKNEQRYKALLSGRVMF